MARSASIFFIVAVLGQFCSRLGVLAERALEQAIRESGGDESDVSSIFKVARKWYDAEKTRSDSVEVLHHLADANKHVLACAKLGHHYINQGDPGLAVKYFTTAGENGPHHQSIYNAGRILAENNDWVGSLAFLKAAATLHLTHSSEYISEETTKAALDAFEIVTERLAHEELPMVQVADIFLFGSLQDLPEDAKEMWTKAVMALMQLSELFDKDEEVMLSATQALRLLWETHGAQGSLSKLQIYLLLDSINSLLGPLAALDDAYVPMAAGYAETFAFRAVYCYEHFAATEDESACFNRAAASAMSFYRRVGDGGSAKRVLQAAQQHPKASTHWIDMEQTPRVFHPGVVSIPWWKPSDFTAALSLQAVFKENSKLILEELETIKALREGYFRGAYDQPTTVGIEADGSVRVDWSQIGFQRIFTPYIGVRTETKGAREEGAGGWAQFGPLFDGESWNEGNCRLVPTICQALKNDASLCTARAKHGGKSVWQRCGTDAVVSILRLRPGTTILPHSGTTNSRLILHFALEGTQGVEITVGGKLVMDYGEGDGNAVVFDDSYEHSIYHGGQQDHFVVLAVLMHPELQRNTK